MELVVGIVIAILVYWAIGVVVLARADGTSVLDFIVALGFASLLVTLVWPFMLILRLRSPASSQGHARPGLPDQDYLGVKGEAVTDLKPWGRIRVSEQQLDARSDMGFVEMGASVRVVGIERRGLVVRRNVT